ncbi:MAG: S-layer homology domain-containing protein [Oscillospiraceae bacterium]
MVWAAKTNVLRGYGNGKFGPNDAVSKEMLNLVIARQKGEDPVWVAIPSWHAWPPALRSPRCCMI